MPVLSGEGLILMKKAGLILRKTLDYLAEEIRAGISTKKIESLAAEFIASRGGECAFLGYKGYPAAVCTSINSVVVHGIPDENDILKPGDIISVDVGVRRGGYYADAARTYAVGRIRPDSERLMKITREALYKGIEKAVSGNRIGDISWAVQSHIEPAGFSVVKAFVGHGIGANIHEEPEVPNFGQPGRGMLLTDGMAIAIEPMVNAGTNEVRILEDGWTAVTVDGERSAHFEHTIIINGKNPEIVT